MSDGEAMKVFVTNNVEVRIYSSKAAMRKRIRSLGYNCDHTESMVIPVKVIGINENGKQFIKPLVAEMYLHNKISMPVLVHETVHATTSVMRRNREKLNLSTRIGYKEELFAYTQTAILQDILTRFFPKSNSQYDLSDIKKWARGSRKENSK